MLRNTWIVIAWGAIALTTRLPAFMPTAVAADVPKVVKLEPSDPTSVPAEVRLPDAPPVYAILETQRPPKIDGKLDDPAWQQVPPMGRMYLDSGQGAMSKDTVVRLLRDKDYLYLAVDCLHPKIDDINVGASSRDKISNFGEAVELFVQTDRTNRNYVHVIFHMSEAFLDEQVRNPNETDRSDGNDVFNFGWNGDIVAATDVGGTGWRLEAKIKIADLGVDGRIDPHAWGINVARNCADESGSWARICGRYHKPEEFGLATMCKPSMAIEDVGAGALSLPDAKEKASVVRLRLRNLKSAEPSTAIVRLTAVTAEDHTLASSVQEIVLKPSATQDLLARLNLSGAKDLNVVVEAKGLGQLFAARLPIVHKDAKPDTLNGQRFSCGIRLLRPIASNPEQAKVYLLAWTNPAQAMVASGQLTLSAQWDGKEVWRQPVSVEMSEPGFASALVSLPAELMKDGQYDVCWIPDDKQQGQRVVSPIEYTQVDRDLVQQLLTPDDVEEVLGKMGCPVPSDPHDRALVAVRIDRLAKAIEPPKAEQDGKRKDQQPEPQDRVLHALRQLRDVVRVLRDEGHYVERRRSWFECAFFSTADDSAQPYSLCIPIDYDKHPGRKYPLVVSLHGSGGTHGGEVGYNGKVAPMDCISLLPLGRGQRQGYSRLSAVDVLQAIDDVKVRYRVEPDAVFLFGVSMGGFGTFEIASRWPDLFAACRPYCGGGAWWPLEQMSNLPTVIHHGLEDEAVGVCNARFVAARMNAAGCPLQVYLHPGVRHRVTLVADRISPWERFRDIRRDVQPRTVIVDSDLPMLRKAYWLAVPRAGDLHEPAYLRATFPCENHLAVSANNVAWATIALPLRWVNPAEPLQITSDTGDQWTQITTGDARTLYLQWDQGKLAATTRPSGDLEDSTVYAGGGVENLFWLGRPVRIIYGTAGSAEQTQALRSLAESIRRYHHEGVDSDVGSYPVLKDTDVDERVLKTCDLILLGTPQINSLVSRMAANLPVKFVKDQVMIEATPRMQWPADQVAFCFFYRNPLQPDRRIWWISGVQDRTAFGKLVKPTEGLLGPFAPELIVANRTGLAVMATARIVGDWKLARPAPLRPVRGAWPLRTDMDKEFGQFLRKTYNADICLVGVVPEGESVEWESLTVGEALLFTGKRMMAVATATGADLQKWLPARKEEFKKWNLQQYEPPWVGPAADSLDPEKTYTLLLSTWEGESMDTKGIHPRYLRFVQEQEFEQARDRFICERGLRVDQAGAAEAEHQ